MWWAHQPVPLGGNQDSSTTSRTLAADAGTCSLIGEDARLWQGRSLDAGAGGPFDCLGQPCGFVCTRRITAEAVAIRVYGQDVPDGQLPGGGCGPSQIGISIGF